MRTETQNIVDAIRGSIELVSRRMDRETARHRLEEYNARVEDPTLWNDPSVHESNHFRRCYFVWNGGFARFLRLSQPTFNISFVHDLFFAQISLNYLAC